ncbi:MAG TPA: hypothetical protein PLK41_04540 [Defluviitoga tunisiensis]|nr:hypothetical protein [bacterium]HPP10239.1 hypothetical protein [Defluviitoga tunisiensis]
MDKRKRLKVRELKDKQWERISKKIALYQYRSGEEFFALVFKSGLSEEEILKKVESYNVKLYPNELKYYKSVLTNPFVLGQRLTYDIIEYLSSRFGLYRVNLATILSEIIFLGRANLWKNQKVSVQDLLKAISLQRELEEGGSSKRVMEEIEKLLTIEESETKGESDVRTNPGPQETGILPEDKVSTDRESDTNT